MMSSHRQEILLDAIRLKVREFPFRFEDHWATVISSKQEAVFDWLAVQQTLVIEDAYGDSMKSFQSVTDGVSVDTWSYEKGDTIGVIDVGGASVEISFEPSEEFRTDKHFDGAVVDGTDFTEVDSGIGSVYIGGTIYQVYSSGYGEVGHREFLNHYQRLLYDENFIQEQSSGYVLDDPCGWSEFVIQGTFTGSKEKPVYLYGSADPTRCIETIRKVWKNILGCESYDCIKKGQPSVEKHLFIGFNTFLSVQRSLDLDDRPYILELLYWGQQILDMEVNEAVELLTGNPDDVVTAYADIFNTFYLYVMLTDM